MAIKVSKELKMYQDFIERSFQSNVTISKREEEILQLEMKLLAMKKDLKIEQDILVRLNKNIEKSKETLEVCYREKCIVFSNSPMISIYGP